MLVEELNDNAKLTDSDYEELAEYLENLLNEPSEDTEKLLEDVVESEEE